MSMNTISYNEVSLERLKTICLPLYEYFNINHFVYLKVLSNGRLMHITTNHDWAKRSIELGVHDDPTHVENLIIKTSSTGQYIFHRTGKPEGKVLSALFDFGMWNGLSICKNASNTFELFGFFTDTNNDYILDSYLNSLNLFERFCIYFKEKAADIIDHQDSSKLFMPKKVATIFNHNKTVEKNFTKNFILQTKIQNFKLENDGIIYKLSRREAECLYFMSRGCSMKEIARYLKLSPRTIEVYINNLKLKTGICYRSKLIELFLSSPLKHMLDNLETN